MPSNSFTFALNRDSIVRLLSLIVAGLITTHLILQYLSYEVENVHWLLVQLFDVDVEDSIPTWYSAAALLFSGLLAYLKYSQARVQEDHRSIYWLIISCGMVFLSLDEIAGFHETLNTLTEFSWTIPAAIILIIGAPFFAKFLFQLEDSLRNQLIFAGAVFLGGAVGVEYATEGYAEAELLDTLAYNTWTAVEEMMEMAGVVIFIDAMLREVEGEVRVEAYQTNG
ncbi:MAG: hypothetical protein AAF541_23840 [Pseudomonadota bacterium]